MAEAFSFTVPECEQGVTLKVKAPDGVTLKIPLPENVLPGDELHLGKGEDENWGITKCLRGVPAEADPAAPEPQWWSAADLASACAGPEAVTVRLETTKGPILIKVVPSWAPIGAQRFLELVADGYYSEVAIYRAINHGLLQFGVVKGTDPRSSQYERLPDDPLVGIPYAEGIVGFAAAGPGTRKSTVCIMKADFRTQLGKGALGTPSTETPFGMVFPESMAVMHSITCLGDIPQCGGKGPCPGKLEELGNDYIHSEFPACDFVIGAATV
mmetsp:Transcript_12995/g.35380  ORF Transcript_12995/g.35380 Transcript_12995/m.35380 type:complete len:270 (-) Transcript_12995:86-895(-)|eukprot:CAMPEP_0177180284 /NCGR_PEP_ID=MMETSP0367-20130122/15313_1 /TAXON_ID=447022 ORGANISM="Scrippsiella hangoei-like, Strain SHHI-4" /NCGR_SAMPLE_ID=MMETSP0367 /ASSEMBLY_ACC=CAM_ASM_000362 /LENGTH=269 /DNA_ID=CAMNT_0018627065 /DNA_START=53 /DNA_END=862 /DNA_ORIENTATION=-